MKFVDPGTGAKVESSKQKLSTTSKALVNLVGYVSDGPKIAVVIAGGSAGTFTIVNSTGTQVYPASGTKAMTTKAADANSLEAVQLADFSDFKTAGTGYRVKATVAGVNYESETFSVSANVYADAKLGLAAMKYFVWKSCGMAAPADAAVNSAGHAVCHSADSAMGAYNGWRSGTFDVAGGWHDAGDHTKYLENQALAAWQLMNLWERTKDVADSAGTKLSGVDTGVTGALPDLVNQIAWGTRWVRGTLPNPTTVVAAPAAFTDLAANKCGNTAWPAYPSSSESDTSTRYCMGPSTSATYSAARNLAHAARVINPYGTAASGVTLDGSAQTAAGLAGKYWATAKEAYSRASGRTVDLSKSDLNWAQSPGFNVASGPYQDDDMNDDKFAAAVEMYLSSCVMDGAANTAYKTAVTGHANYKKMAMYDWGTESPLGDVAGEEAGMGTLSLLAAAKLGICGANAGLPVADVDAMKANLATYAATLRADMAGQSYPFYGKDGAPVIWGSNASQATAANILIQDYEYNANTDSLRAAYRMMDYLLGVNPMRTSYIIGFGMRSGGCCAVTAVHDRPMNAAKKLYGTMVGGPLSIQDKLNSSQKDPATPKTGAPLKRFANTTGDGGSSWESEENAVNWNSALAAAAWGLQLYSDKMAGTTDPGTPPPPPPPQCTSAANCNDNNACTNDACTNGACSHSPKSCNDSNSCTVDSCDSVTGCKNENTCCLSNADCNDNNTCTTDACNTTTGACTHTDTCATSAGLKVESKSDADPANAEIKIHIRLSNTSNVDEPLSGLELRYFFLNDPGVNANSYIGECDWSSVGCTNITRVTSGTTKTAMADNFLKVTFSSGAGNVPKNGNIEIQLRLRTSDYKLLNESNDYSYKLSASNYIANSNIAVLKGSTVVFGIQPGGDPPVSKCTSAANCSDSNLCTDDICNADGTCTNPVKSCTDNNVCTTDTCIPATGCNYQNNALTCDGDTNPCTTDVCNAGVCVVGVNSCPACTTANQATACNDNKPCTVDTCVSGVCKNTAKDCNDGNPCTNDSCNLTNGSCANAAVTNGTVCTSDSNGCTNDICTSGACTHPTVTPPTASCECILAADCAEKAGYTKACNGNKCSYTSTNTGTGGTGSGGTGGTGGTTGTNPCAGLASSPQLFTQANFQSGNLGKTAKAYEYVGNINGIVCGNMGSRTFAVNGAAFNCSSATPPAKRNNGYCFVVSAGDPEWAYMATY